MAMAITLNSKPRFKERQSRSFRSLQPAKGEKENKSFAKGQESLVTSMDRFQKLDVGELRKRLPISQRIENYEHKSSAAKHETIKCEEPKTLEPIDELSPENIDMLKGVLGEDGQLTESDVQELLLSFTHTSGKIEHLLKNSSNKDSPLPNSSLSSLRETLKSRWADALLSVIDKLDRLQAKSFECFWKSILYFNFWFPQWASIIRYVTPSIISLSYRITLLTFKLFEAQPMRF